LGIEQRAIKFYLDNSVNQVKKDKIIRFLEECRNVQNYLYNYYWNDEKFIEIIKSKTKVEFSYHNDIDYRDIQPRLKSHHFYQVCNQVFANLKSIQSNIINKIYFKFDDDKDKKAIYNYCSGFCFDWINLEKYIKKQLKLYKKKDKKYYEFLSKIQLYINDKELYIQLKQDIENRFYEIKSKYKCPNKKELQIICNTTHTVDIELKEFQWIFTIDNNDIIGGSEKRSYYDKLIIPVKFSNYHREILQDKKLANSFTLKLNRYNRIEIIGCYEVETNNPIPKDNAELIGIDIGLKKLITSSDGEIIEQNLKILKKLDKIMKKQANRQTFEKYLQKKLGDDFALSDKRYLLKQTKLTDFVKCDNRFKIKQFLKGREDNHIVMEDLEISSSATSSKVVNNMLKRLHIQYIKNDIVKYSKEQGIKVSLINPAYTSQECPICGHISKENRKTQEKFCCVNCNHTDDADHNASVNIMNRLNRKDIKLNMSLWRVRQILNMEI
jgi:putative transposase